jgi:hypothetical protein
MVGTRVFFDTGRRWITILVIGLVLILGTACGGSDEETAAAASDSPSLVSDTATLESEAIVDDDLSDPETVTSSTKDERIAPAEAVVPKVQPESGSDEEAILEVFDRVIRSIRAEDTYAYVEACNPTRPRLSEAQTKFVFESVFAPYGELTGITHRDVTIRTFDDDTALTESIMYDYDQVLFSRFAYGFSKVEGNWYADSNCR